MPAVYNRLYVESNVVTGVDWRNRVSYAPADARSLGAMESNGDKLTANRMKKRGMSWTIRGAHRMAKVIQLSRNGELTEFCRAQTRHHPDRYVVYPSPTQRRESASTTRVSDWGGASVPALIGPHSSRPWTRSLRNLVQSLNLHN